jgi:hypothetical protein
MHASSSTKGSLLAAKLLLAASLVYALKNSCTTYYIAVLCLLNGYWISKGGENSFESIAQVLHQALFELCTLFYYEGLHTLIDEAKRDIEGATHIFLV